MITVNYFGAGSIRGRGQAPLQYLMTYAWVIIAVTALGFILWYFGVLSFGDDEPAGSGFQQVTALYSSCRMSSGVWAAGGGLNGSSCSFYNGRGWSIVIKGLNITVDGKTCQYMVAEKGGSYVYRECVDAFGDCGELVCAGYDCDSSKSPLMVPKDGTFTVYAVSNESWLYDNPAEPCNRIVEGRRYNLHVDIEYDTLMAGTQVTRHSEGDIYVTGR